MYKIMIHIDTHTNDTWFYYQEEGKDYVANSLEEIRETVLTLIDVYGEDYIKIVKQETGDDMSGSVETFLYDSTDNYEELVNRPFINGVEIVGALSLAELGIQPVGNYATNERVETLEETVNNIDLSPYATNERVDQVEAKVDAIDLEPYATMDYLDEVVAGIDFSASNENITGVKTFSVLPRSTVAPVAEDELTNKAYVDHEVFGCATEEYVDEAIANTKIPVFEVASLGAAQYDAYMTEEEGKRFLEYCNEHYNEFIQVYLYCPTLSLSGIYSGTPVANDWGNGIFKLYSNATGYKSGIIYSTHLYVNANMTEDGRFDTTQSCRPYIHCDTMLNVSANYLSRTNTREYTPTTAYHPATKKYVDDAVAANAGTTIYSELTDKPSINNVVLEGNKTLEELGIQPVGEYLIEEADPTVPDHVKAITEDQITKWDSSGDSGSTLIYEFDLANADQDFTSGEIALNAEQLGRLKTIIQELLDNGAKGNYNILLYNSEKRDGRSVLLSEQVLYQLSNLGRSYTFQYAQFSGINTHGDIFQTSTEAFTLRLEIVIMNDNLVIDRINNAWIYWNNGVILTTASNRFYEPFEDYNPATKKYVDDAIANIDVSDVDLTNYYNKTEVDNKINEMLSSAITNTLEGGY